MGKLSAAACRSHPTAMAGSYHKRGSGRESVPVRLTPCLFRRCRRLPIGEGRRCTRCTTRPRRLRPNRSCCHEARHNSDAADRDHARRLFDGSALHSPGAAGAGNLPDRAGLSGSGDSAAIGHLKRQWQHRRANFVTVSYKRSVRPAVAMTRCPSGTPNAGGGVRYQNSRSHCPRQAKCGMTSAASSSRAART